MIFLCYGRDHNLFFLLFWTNTSNLGINPQTVGEKKIQNLTKHTRFKLTSHLSGHTQAAADKLAEVQLRILQNNLQRSK